jgi:hypothetical protein
VGITDRRVPTGSADIDNPTDVKRDRDGREQSVQDAARMKEKNEWGRVRYPSQTLETRELWQEEFGADEDVMPYTSADYERKDDVRE